MPSPPSSTGAAGRSPFFGSSAPAATVFSTYLWEVMLAAAGRDAPGLVLGAALPFTIAAALRHSLSRSVCTTLSMPPRSPLPRLLVFSTIFAFSLWPLARAKEIGPLELVRHLPDRLRWPRSARPPAALGRHCVTLVILSFLALRPNDRMTSGMSWASAAGFSCSSAWRRSRLHGCASADAGERASALRARQSLSARNCPSLRRALAGSGSHPLRHPFPLDRALTERAARQPVRRRSLLFLSRCRQIRARKTSLPPSGRRKASTLSSPRPCCADGSPR